MSKEIPQLSENLKPQGALTSQKRISVEQARQEYVESKELVDTERDKLRSVAPKSEVIYDRKLRERAIPTDAQVSAIEEVRVEFDGRIDEGKREAKAALAVLSGSIGTEIQVEAKRETGVDSVGLDTDLGPISVGLEIGTSGEYDVQLNLPHDLSLMAKQGEEGTTLKAEYELSTEFGNFTLSPTRRPDGQIDLSSKYQLRDGPAFQIDYKGGEAQVGVEQDIGIGGGELALAAETGREEHKIGAQYTLRF